MIEKYVNVEELKRLISSLLVVVGALVLAGLFASIVVPGLRNANRPEVQTPVSPVLGEPGWLDPTEFPPRRGKVIPPVDAKALMSSSPASIEKGSEIFKQSCVPCHGAHGLGDGPAAATLDPRPRNFTSPSGWTNGYDLASIFKTVSEGVKGTGMASFDYFTKADRIALAHYVQALGAFPHGKGKPEATAALAKELSAPGEKTPNRIPVSMAMAKLEQEFTASPPLAVDPADHTPGAEALRRAVSDPARAGQSLAVSREWRAGSQELAASILNGAPANGFSVSAAIMSPDEWKALYSELVRRMGH